MPAVRTAVSVEPASEVVTWKRESAALVRVSQKRICPTATGEVAEAESRT
jgi:hypothetical protein